MIIKESNKTLNDTQGRAFPVYVRSVVLSDERDNFSLYFDKAALEGHIFKYFDILSTSLYLDDSPYCEGSPKYFTFTSDKENLKIKFSGSLEGAAEFLKDTLIISQETYNSVIQGIHQPLCPAVSSNQKASVIFSLFNLFLSKNYENEPAGVQDELSRPLLRRMPS